MDVLIKWEDTPEFEATWEDYAAIDQRFPFFYLEDKVAVWVGVMQGINPQPLLKHLCYDKVQGQQGNM